MPFERSRQRLFGVREASYCSEHREAMALILSGLRGGISAAVSIGGEWLHIATLLAFLAIFRYRLAAVYSSRLMNSREATS